MACQHLICCSPIASLLRPGMGSDLARIHSCTCAHCLFTS
ncbi:mCG1041353 [Mus musculus]|nr:mCG1041353 [Mus musculus]